MSSKKNTPLSVEAESFGVDNNPWKLDVGSDAVIGTLLQRLGELVEKLRESSTRIDPSLHFVQSLEACRLSRKIRFKLGNLWKLDEVTRHRFSSSLLECAESMNTNLPYGSDERQLVTRARDNVKSRASHIADPRLVQEHVLSATGDRS